MEKANQYRLNMRVILFLLITAIISLFTNDLIYSQNVDASIEISEKNQGKITFTFERENVGDEKFFITSLNLLNNTTHEIPFEYDESNELTFLTGSWYNKKNDLFIGTNLMIGHNSEQVKLVLPSAVYAGQNNRYSIRVEKPDADFKSIIHSAGNLEYLNTNNVEITLNDPNIEVLEKSESFAYNGIDTYKIDFKEYKSGYINYTYISFWYLFINNIWFLLVFITPLYFVRIVGNNNEIQKKKIITGYLLTATIPLIITIWSFLNYGKTDQLTIIFVLLFISFPVAIIIPLSWAPYIRALQNDID